MATAAAPVVWPAALAARPLLIADAHAEELRDAWIAAEAEHRDMAAAGRSFDLGRSRYATVDGVAVIPISGALMNRYDFLGDGSPYSSYPAITREVQRAAADPSIRAIILAINSPGGSAAGILAPAAAIREARKAKPVTALVGSMAASGGYWLAAQAGEIVLQDDMAEVGSIGVYRAHVSLAGALDKAGVAVTLISSGRNKVDGHPFAALPDSVRADFQTEADDLRLLFARQVATGRPVLTEAAALETEARMFPALDARTGRRPAIAAKLADRVASLPAVIAGLAAGKSQKIQGVHDMDEAAARAAERTRIKEILTSPAAEGRAEQANYLAMSTDLSAAQAVGLLASAPQATAKPQAKTYEQRKAEAGAGGFVEVDAPKATAKAGWGKAVAAANAGLGPNAVTGNSQ